MDTKNDFIDGLDSDIASESPMDAVFEKIEQANLYKALLNEQLFDESSASPEVVRKVTEEVHQFVSQRLQMLVGLISPEAVTQPLPFSDRQIAALRILADRILNPAKPPLQSSSGNIKVKKSIVTAKQPLISRPGTNKPAVVADQSVKQPARSRSDNVSEFTGQDYSQAVDPNNRPVRPPSQEEMNLRNANIAAQNTTGLGQGGDWGKLLQSAVAVYQKQNSNIVED